MSTNVRRLEIELAREGRDPRAYAAEILGTSWERFWLLTPARDDPGSVASGKIPVTDPLNDARPVTGFTREWPSAPERWEPLWAIAVTTLEDTESLIEHYSKRGPGVTLWDRKAGRVCERLGTRFGPTRLYLRVEEGWREPRHGPAPSPVSDELVLENVRIEGLDADRRIYAGDMTPVYVNAATNEFTIHPENGVAAAIGGVLRRVRGAEVGDVVVRSGSRVPVDAWLDVVAQMREGNAVIFDATDEIANNRFGVAGGNTQNSTREPPVGHGTILPYRPPAASYGDLVVGLDGAFTVTESLDHENDLACSTFETVVTPAEDLASAFAIAALEQGRHFHLTSDGSTLLDWIQDDSEGTRVTSFVEVRAGGSLRWRVRSSRPLPALHEASPATRAP